MSKYKSLEHSIKDLLLEKLHDPNPEEEGVFATSPRKSPKFETKADEERAKSDTAVRKGREPLIARPEDDRGDSIIRRQDSDSSERPHHQQFVRKIDVGEDTIMTKLPQHLLEVVNKSLDATGEGEITQKDILIRRLEASAKKGKLDAKGKALLKKLRDKNKMRNESVLTSDKIAAAVKNMSMTTPHDPAALARKRKESLEFLKQQHKIDPNTTRGPESRGK